jgi:hypothetical protein
MSKTLVYSGNSPGTGTIKVGYMLRLTYAHEHTHGHKKYTHTRTHTQGMQHLSDYEAMMMNYGISNNVFCASDTPLLPTSLRNHITGGIVNAKYDNPYQEERWEDY